MPINKKYFRIDLALLKKSAGKSVNQVSTKIEFGHLSHMPSYRLLIRTLIYADKDSEFRGINQLKRFNRWNA